MKFNDCTLKGLVWMQALEACDNPFSRGTQSPPPFVQNKSTPL